MNNLMTRQELWVENRQFYDDLIKKYHWKQEPMITLIDQLREAGFCEKFYPSNSHESLGLCSAKEFLQRTERNMVYIKYQNKNAKFEVVYQKGQGHTVKTKLILREEISSEFDEMEDWLTRTPE